MLGTVSMLPADTVTGHVANSYLCELPGNKTLLSLIYDTFTEDGAMKRNMLPLTIRPANDQGILEK